MKPELVKPSKFNIHTVIYDNGEFSIAYGKWENTDLRLAMRWNGDSEEEVGYPSQGGNPLWFQLPNEGIWTSEILQAVERIRMHEDKINGLNELLKP